MRNRNAPFTLIPGNEGLLAGEHNFTERAAIQMFKRLFKLVKTVAMLNHRLQPRDVNSADKIFQRPAVPHANPLNDGGFQQQFASREGNLRPGEHANDGDTSVNGNGAQGMLQVLSTDGFDNMVDTAMPWLAPSVLASASFSSLPEVTNTSAPCAFAI